MRPDSPKIAIVGAGALGGYFGVRLAHSGQQVHFLVRSEAETLRSEGFILEREAAESIRVGAPNVHTAPQSIGACAIVLIALKTTANDELLTLLPPLLQPNTLLFTVQNGLGNVEFLQQHFPNQRILAGLSQIGVNRIAPGHLRSFVPGDGFVLLGEVKGPPAEDANWMQQLLARAGIQVRLADSHGEALWRKLMWNIPYNGLTILSGGVGTDIIVGNEQLNALSRTLMEEIRAAANAMGFPIEDGYSDKLIGFTRKLGKYLPSSLLDFQAGKAVEVEAIFGNPLRAGIEHNVPMPHLQTIYWLLKGLTDKS